MSEKTKIPYALRLEIWEINYGRDAEWVVEENLLPIAFLSDPKYVEMFWESYIITPVLTNKNVLSKLFDETFWDTAEKKGITFRSRKFGITVDAFPAVSPCLDKGRISMRRLYIDISPPRAIDRIVLHIRSWLVKLRLS